MATRTPSKSHWKRTVHTWAQWQQAADEARQHLQLTGRPAGDCKEAFFRGHGDASWTLLPTLLRQGAQLKLSNQQLLATEADMFWEFQARAQELHGLNLTDWDYLFFMRHHGAATRLLDWTESLGVALYFALERPGPDRTPSVWVLNPYLLNEHSARGLRDLISPRYIAGYGDLMNSGRLDWRHPWAIYPIQRSNRMRAQRGWFTIHGSSRQPLEVCVPRAVAQITLADEAIPGARRFLEDGGFNEYSIYTDLDSLCRDLHRKHGLT